MGYEIQGEDTDFGHEVYTRRAKLECHALGVEWAGRMQGVLDTGKLIRPPVREIGGGGQFRGCRHRLAHATDWRQSRWKGGREALGNR